MTRPTIRDGWPDDWRPTPLQIALERLERSADRLAESATRLRESVDRLTGGSSTRWAHLACGRPNVQEVPRTSLNYIVQSKAAEEMSWRTFGV